MNCLAAACGAIHLGLTPNEIREGIANCDAAPGRMEAVNCGQPFQVFVDYAHTDDAIKHVIKTSRSFTTGRTILVFGAGGDRDKSKRIPMGVAATAADVVVLTSDNPRNESPESIIEEIKEGFHGSAVEPLVEIDRQAAIAKAIQIAEPNDTVLVVGKGHEKYQIVNESKTPFDDVAACRTAIWQAMQHAEHLHLPAKAAG